MASNNVAKNFCLGLANWDGQWFLRIAKYGYNLKSAAFFPLYPYLIQLLTRLGINSITSGVLLANFSLLLICFCFYKLLELDYEEPVCSNALWYLMFFPTSFYFNALYSESLFLLLVLLAFYAARKRLWFCSSLAGLLAALTRNLGCLLIIPLFCEYILQKKQSRSHIQADSLWLLLIPLGLLIYMALLWKNLGDPLAFVHAQQYWHRSFTYPWQAISLAVENVMIDFFKVRNTLDLVFTLFSLALLGLSYKRVRISYLLFGILGVALPLWAAAPQAGLFSMPRYVLILFPIFITMATFHKNQTIHQSLIVFITGILITLLLLFCSARWVA